MILKDAGTAASDHVIVVGHFDDGAIQVLFERHVESVNSIRTRREILPSFSRLADIYHRLWYDFLSLKGEWQPKGIPCILVFSHYLILRDFFTQIIS